VAVVFGSLVLGEKKPKKRGATASSEKDEKLLYGSSIPQIFLAPLPQKVFPR